MGYIDCASCGINFWITDELEERRRRDHEMFYCPNGHNNYFAGKNKWEKQIEELQSRIKQLERFEQNAWDERNKVLDEFASCPFDNCPMRTYHYANRRTLLNHLADKHGIRLIERLALPPGKAV